MGRKKNSELIELSDDALGVATITSAKAGSILIYFDEAVVNDMDCQELIFNRHNLSARPANTLDESGCKLSPRNTKGGSAMYLSKVSNYEELIGKYEVVKEDGEYKLYPINGE